MGIHKYGPDTSLSQLGLKSLGTRVHECLTCCVICVVICVNNIHGGLYMEY